MDFINTSKIIVKTFPVIVFVLIIIFGALLYVGNSGIPFIEGDHRVLSGKAYNFEIGMTKPQVFGAIREYYENDGYYLRILWLRQSDEAKELEIFENTESKKYTNRKYGEYKVQIKDLGSINLPLRYGSRWDIEMPAEWVNDIYLEFKNEKLVRIQKSRRLFERP